MADHEEMLEQLLQGPPTTVGGAAVYGKALHEIAQAVAEERLDLGREKQAMAAQVREIESQGANLRDVPDNLRAILTGVQSLQEADIAKAVTTVQRGLEAKLFADVTAIKESLSQVQVLAEGLVAKSDETQQRVEGVHVLLGTAISDSNAVNGRVNDIFGRLDALARQCAQMKISATSLQIDCRNAVLASIEARDVRTEAKLASLQAATGHTHQVVKSLGQKVYDICAGELAVIYKAVAESGQGIKNLTSDVGKAKDEYKVKCAEYQAKHDEYKAKYEAECRRAEALEKELQEVRDGPKMPSDASKTLDHLCSLVDQTFEEVLN